jgi:hypothetical protein
MSAAFSIVLFLGEFPKKRHVGLRVPARKTSIRIAISAAGGIGTAAAQRTLLLITGAVEISRRQGSSMPD